MEREQATKLMQDLLRRMVERRGSDLFITAGFPPAIKIDGEVRPQAERSLTSEQSAVLTRAIMGDRQLREFDATKECQFAISPQGIGRFRVSAFVQQGNSGCVIRTIATKIPSIDELRLPSWRSEASLLWLVALDPVSPPRLQRWLIIGIPKPAVISSRLKIPSNTFIRIEIAW